MELSQEAVKALNEIGKIYEDGLRKEMNIPEDWRYLSTSTSKSAFQNLTEVIGDAKVEYVVIADHGNGNMRFTAFFSPEAVQKVLEFRNKMKAEN
jgi:hypothetical protein